MKFPFLSGTRKPKVALLQVVINYSVYSMWTVTETVRWSNFKKKNNYKFIIDQIIDTIHILQITVAKGICVNVKVNENKSR